MRSSRSDTVAFGEEISKILPEWSHPDRALAAFDRIWEDLPDLPLIPEDEIDRTVDQGHFVFSTISQPWTLSGAQEEALLSVSRGERPIDIAKRKGIANKTVNEHLARARIRLRAKTNEEAVAVAIGSGIIPAINRDPKLGDRMNVRNLARRHKDVLRLVADGDTNEEIGERLGLSHETIKDYVKEIIQVMGARNRTHAVALAFATGRLVMSSSRHKEERPQEILRRILAEDQKEGAPQGALDEQDSGPLAA